MEVDLLMKRKILFEKKLENNCFVKYYLLADKSKIDGKNLFGVEIEFFVHGDNLETYAAIPKITQSEKIALKIIDLLAKNDVTPNSLDYVIDEIYDVTQKF